MRSEQGFLQFLRGVDVIPVNRTIRKELARIRGQLRQLGQIIGDLDIMIATTAIYHDVFLLPTTPTTNAGLPRLST
jgi:predicted nucleic acid-binding protein